MALTVVLPTVLRWSGLVSTLDIDAFRAVFNADYNRGAIDDGTADDSVGDDTAGDNTASFYGLSLALGYAFTDLLGVAARYEFLSDTDNTLAAIPGADEVILHTITGTFDIKPIPGRDSLILRWDNRFERSSAELYEDIEALPTDRWFASVLGVVVKTDG
jgi:hypothetical protein